MDENPKGDIQLTNFEAPPPKRGFGARVRGYFFTGLLVAGPLAITAYITWWLIHLIDGWVKPLIPATYNPETYLPFAVPGLGLLVAFVALVILGFFTANLVGRWIVGLGERILDRMPFVRSLYKAVKQIFETVFKQDGTSLRRVGLLEWPGPGLWSICLLSEPVNPDITDKISAAGFQWIYIPTTPAPTTGYLVMVRQDSVIEIDMSVDDAFKLLMSMGIIQPQPPAGSLPAKARKVRLTGKKLKTES
ncbi:membrane protein [Agaricicola taiwanensis]|uniref:Membrane protein n=2 Tax=Agaricicola taiwanensis TaxID=591372 RepID=A0A8J2YIH0_9RHOB|nr:membrane protein [Agaricicola taiwanensis]